MARQIEFTIDKDGKVRTDFRGFKGDDCFAEAEQLKELLSHLGLSIDVTEMVPKPAAQIEEEMGVQGDAEEAGLRHDDN